MDLWYNIGMRKLSGIILTSVFAVVSARANSMPNAIADEVSIGRKDCRALLFDAAVKATRGEVQPQAEPKEVVVAGFCGPIMRRALERVEGGIDVTPPPSGAHKADSAATRFLVEYRCRRSA